MSEKRPPSALADAFSVQHEASLKGFDWSDPRDALAKVREESDEVASLLGDAASADGEEAPVAGLRLEEELGDLLFAVVNVARIAGVEPARALVRATRKFEARFAAVERLARLRRLPMPGTSLAELDRIWDEVKSVDPGHAP